MKLAYKNNIVPHAASFRDSSGFLYYNNRILYRQVNLAYSNEYEALRDSGLYNLLIEKKMLVRHSEVGLEYAYNNGAYKILKPELISFISYSYEWCFSQLKDAALLTLDIQLEALKKRMSLKDASAYNVQFHQGSPIFIDTLSFEQYKAGQPWVAYTQFCQHFLAPLALMAYTDIRLNRLLQLYVDGIPLDIASKLLPLKTKLKLSLYLHIHLHAKKQKQFSNTTISKVEKEGRASKLSKKGLVALLIDLKKCVEGMTCRTKKSQWGDYYTRTHNYGSAMSSKEKIVADMINKLRPNLTWDLGANDGKFSRLALRDDAEVIAWDIDPACVENNYLQGKRIKPVNLLPLLVDLTNPSPGIGWDNCERFSFKDRKQPDLILALGLIHHLVISNSLSMSQIAEFLAGLTNYLVIEFIPREDSQIEKIASNRQDILSDYTEDKFERDFKVYFEILEVCAIPDTLRTVYCMKKKGGL